MFATDLGAASVPGRGLFLSVLLHCLFALATLVVPWSYWMPPDVHLLTMQEQARAHQTLLLPDLQPMSRPTEPAPAPGSGELARKSTKPASRAAAAAPAAAKAVRGTVDEGPQIIVSNPHPDNFQQTILQPDLPPAKFSAPLPIPPMVSIARAPVLMAPPPQPKPAEAAPAPPVAVLPASVAQQLPSVDAPKLPLPANVSEQAAASVPSAAVPASVPKLARAPVPLAAESGDADHNVLVIDAISVPNARPAELPPGELHGAFTVMPTELIASRGSGKAGGGNAEAGAPGVGAGSGTAAGSYAGSGNMIGAAGGTGTAAAQTGAGTGAVAANGLGSGDAGIAGGTGTAAGEGAGRGTGTGIGKSPGSGSGAGTGIGSGHGMGLTIQTAGNSPFQGITIQGGSTSGAHYSNRVPAIGKPQTSYDVTVVASGASGGGFRDYGVFRDGASYTVYLDMADVGVRSDWPLQYAPDFGPNQPDPPVAGALQPPFVLAKVLPRLSADAVRRSQGGKIVVFGVINAEGRWERLRVLYSPDPAFRQVVLDALAKWTFKPASAAGHAMAVKCLLGLPVYSLAGR